MNAAVFIPLVFLGCCTNVVFLELLITAYPGSGNIITFAQFLFITIEGFIFTTEFGSKKPIIALKNYLLMVTMFFVVSVVNNWALKFNIPMPLHMIFRAGSLVANLILGMIILKRRYTLGKYISVVMITVGISVSTLASSKQLAGKIEDSTEVGQDWQKYMMLLLGIGMLTFALFTSAGMGILQEVMYKRYGKHPREALFYNHALPLPGFILLYSDIHEHILKFSASPPVDVPLLGAAIPIMWLYLLGNVLTQYVCIRSVFILTTEFDSLTVTLVVTLRKFISLLFSIFYFKNPFTFYHWVGTVLVFGGTLLFSNIHSKLFSALRQDKEQKQNKKQN